MKPIPNEKQVALVGAIERAIVLPFRLDVEDAAKKMSRTRIGMSQWYVANKRLTDEQLAKAFLRAIMKVSPDTLKVSATICLANVEIHPDYRQHGGCKYLLDCLELHAQRMGMRMMVESVMNRHLQDHLMKRGYFSPNSNETADFWLPI